MVISLALSFGFMRWEQVQELSASAFKRSTGVSKGVFEQMAEAVTQYKSAHRKHPSRGKPPKLSIEDKVLLMLMYYREYGTQFHIGLTYGVAESTVCEIIREIESILLTDKGFHLPGKKKLLQSNTNLEVILFDVSESPVERPKKNNEAATQEKRSGTP
jgi:hypothetical protein